MESLGTASIYIYTRTYLQKTDPFEFDIQFCHLKQSVSFVQQKYTSPRFWLDDGVYLKIHVFFHRQESGVLCLGYKCVCLWES